MPMTNIFEDTLCSITHKDGTLVVASIGVQLDQASLQEASMLNAQAPYDVFDAYILQNVDVQRGDILTDISGAIDPDTGQAPRYVVMGKPKVWPDNHVEFRALRDVGDMQ